MSRQDSSAPDVLRAPAAAMQTDATGRPSFHSILFQEPVVCTAGNAPACFHDLNLDQIVSAATAGRDDYDLEPVFHVPLKSLDAIAYRQEIMRDMEHGTVMDAVKFFSARMHAMHENLAFATKRFYKYERERWFLAAVELYCESVESLLDSLSRLGLASAGLQVFREYLRGYRHSQTFSRLAADAKNVADRLSAVNYSLHIHNNGITVTPYEGEPDYSAEVEKIFEKFRRGAAKDHRTEFRDSMELNHVEAEVLDRVALLYPETFQALDRFCAEYAEFQDKRIANFEREIQFYISYLDYIRNFREAGLPFCYPEVVPDRKELSACETFDLALAGRLLGENRRIVTNDFVLREPERIFVVTGPNQGGKTTFARTFGQLHYLAALGCPVPGTKARLFLFDELFCHFEREEDISNLRGRLQDDLIRIRTILEQATPASIVIVNEIFTSTTLVDAVNLSRRIMAELCALDVLGVWVTFLDELAGFNEKTVSLVSGVEARDPRIRTYRIERRKADGLSYAQAIAEKYGLTYRRLKERIKS